MAKSPIKVARIYLRVSTEEQNLARQAEVQQSASTAGYYVAGVYREKAWVPASTGRSCSA